MTERSIKLKIEGNIKLQIDEHGLEKVMNMERSVEMTDEEIEEMIGGEIKEENKYATDYLKKYKNVVKGFQELGILDENRKKQQISLSIAEYVRLINNNSKLNYLLTKLTSQDITPDFTNAPRITEEECNQQYIEIVKEKITQVKRLIEKIEEYQKLETFRDGREQPSRIFTIDVKQEEDTVEHVRKLMVTWNKPEKIITIPLEDYVLLKNKEQKLNIMEDNELDGDIRCSVAMANFHEITEEDYKDDPRVTTKQQRSR